MVKPSICPGNRDHYTGDNQSIQSKSNHIHNPTEHDVAKEAIS